MASNATSHDWLNEHGDYLFRFAMARLRDATMAEDVVQETMLAAIQSKSFAGQSSQRTWLTGILKHKIIDLVRMQSRELVLEDVEEGLPNEPGLDDYFDEDDRHWNSPPQEWGSPDGELEQQQFLTVLQDCMAKLPKNLSRLFMLRDVLEEENENICKELKITTTNAWVMLYRARMGLRQCLELNWLGK